MSFIRALVVANALGSLYVAANALLFHRIYPSGVSAARFVTAIPAGYAVFVLAAFFAYRQGRRHLAPVERWLAADRAPTRDEVAALVGQPAKQATVAMPYWAIAVVFELLYQAYVLHYRPGALAYAKEVPAFALGALIGWTMSYLLIERVCRPILTIAFASGDTHTPLTMRTFPRLLLAWLVSSGAPIIALTITISGLNAQQRHTFVPIIYIGVIVALAAGVFVTLVAAHAVSDPLDDVRTGLRLIAEGNFDVVVPVNDGGEIGLMEAEINRMTRSLRERERLKQLFGRQVGDEVATHALVGEARLGGERRTVSAMFVRIVSTPVLTEDLPAEHVVGAFNQFFDSIVRAVGAEGGVVNKIKSDGALCIFGAPVEYGDHAMRALRTARALHVELSATGGIAAAIGVSTGDVVAGNVGAADRYEYTVIGDAVNEAARLTEHAKQAATPVLVSEATILAAGAEAGGWTDAGTLQLRGRSEPTRAFVPI
jgi:adenylate cyclase